MTIRDKISYDPVSGIFRWLVDRGRTAKRGDVAGYTGPNGYVSIRVDGKLHLAHRLAWYFVNDKWPCREIDHIDRNPSNNRIENLREATSSQNKWNAGRRSDNSSGVKGVHQRSDTGAWTAELQVEYKRVRLGCFKTKEDAVNAYRIAAQKYFGEFAYTATKDPSVPRGFCIVGIRAGEAVA